MADSTTYTAEKKTLKRNGKLLEKRGLPEYELPMRRTDRRYRRRCAACCRFLAQAVKGSYCQECNAQRRRRDRQDAAYKKGMEDYFQKAYSRWGSTTGEVIACLLQDT